MIDVYSDKVVFSTEDGTYERFEKQSEKKYERICIDGTRTGCGRCVGYCSYQGHPGFLTARLRQEHDCIGKACWHYICKPQKRQKSRNAENDASERVLELARKETAGMEGLRVLRAALEGGKWVLCYITISNAYALDSIAKTLARVCGASVRFQNLNYDFDTCVRIITAA